MAGINQLPAGSEIAAAISFIWAISSWLCSCLLLWLTWSHREGYSYLGLLSVSTLFSNTFSIIQQGRDVTWYQDVVIWQFNRSQKLPGDDPELAIAAGAFGVDLVLYYIQYYSYNVQAMLVMFWAAELCQLTYQVGERRKIRILFRKLHAAGKFISWLLPLITILSLQIPALRRSFVPFILITDLPLMLSLAIGSGLMIAVTIRYIQSRQKFTQWSPPNFNSATSGSESGTGASFGGTQTSSRATTNRNTGTKGLYDRWLMVRFTIAFVLLCVFEVTNTLFQITALQNNIRDAKASAPDLSKGRAMQTLFLFMPGTTPGIFLYIVFGTTASSRRKVAALWEKVLPRRRGGGGGGGCCSSCLGRKSKTASLPTTDDDDAPGSRGKITIERSLTITSSNRFRASGKLSDEELCGDPTDIWMDDIPRRTGSAMSFGPGPGATRRPDSAMSFGPPRQLDSTMSFGPPRQPDSAMSFSPRSKPLPLAPGIPSSRFRAAAPLPTHNRTVSSPPDFDAVSPVSSGRLTAIDEKSGIYYGGSVSRPTTGDSSRMPDDYNRLDAEHSDDSGPILPIQRHEVRFSPDVLLPPARAAYAAGRDRQSKNFSFPRR